MLEDGRRRRRRHSWPDVKKCRTESGEAGAGCILWISGTENFRPGMRNGNDSTIKVARWQNLIPSFPWICARVEGWGRTPRKGRDQILQRSVAEPCIFLQAQRARHLQSKNLAIAIWQPWTQRPEFWIPDLQLLLFGGLSWEIDETALFWCSACRIEWQIHWCLGDVSPSNRHCTGVMGRSKCV